MRPQRLGASPKFGSLERNLSVQMIEAIKAQWKGQLIVSCQAAEGEPLHGADHIAALAQTVQMGGAAGIRIDGPENIRAVRWLSDLPLIGSYKIHSPQSSIYVTPTFEAARQTVQAGADLVGIEATCSPRPNGEDVNTIIRRIHEETSAAVVADISTLDEALAVCESQPDFITTAMAGATPQSPQGENFDYDLLSEMVRQINIPILAEGRIYTPEEAAQTLVAGAFAVVVGTAITRPHKITERFVNALKKQS